MSAGFDDFARFSETSGSKRRESGRLIRRNEVSNKDAVSLITPQRSPLSPLARSPLTRRDRPLFASPASPEERGSPDARGGKKAIPQGSKPHGLLLRKVSSLGKINISRSMSPEARNALEKDAPDAPTLGRTRSWNSDEKCDSKEMNDLGLTRSSYRLDMINISRSMSPEALWTKEENSNVLTPGDIDDDMLSIGASSKKLSGFRDHRAALQKWRSALQLLKDKEHSPCYKGCTGKALAHSCRTCNVDMCSDCGRKHETCKLTRSHTVISYEDKKTSVLQADGWNVRMLKDFDMFDDVTTKNLTKSFPRPHSACMRSGQENDISSIEGLTITSTTTTVMTHEEARILAPKDKKESAREREKALGLRSNAPSTPSGYLLTGEPGLGDFIKPPSRPVGPFFRTPSSELQRDDQGGCADRFLGDAEDDKDRSQGGPVNRRGSRRILWGSVKTFDAAVIRQQGCPHPLPTSGSADGSVKPYDPADICRTASADDIHSTASATDVHRTASATDIHRTASADGPQHAAIMRYHRRSSGAMHDENAMKEAPVKEVMRKSRTSNADNDRSPRNPWTRGGIEVKRATRDPAVTHINKKLDIAPNAKQTMKGLLYVEHLLGRDPFCCWCEITDTHLKISGQEDPEKVMYSVHLLDMVIDKCSVSSRRLLLVSIVPTERDIISCYTTGKKMQFDKGRCVLVCKDKLDVDAWFSRIRERQKDLSCEYTPKEEEQKMHLNHGDLIAGLFPQDCQPGKSCWLRNLSCSGPLGAYNGMQCVIGVTVSEKIPVQVWIGEELKTIKVNIQNLCNLMPRKKMSEEETEILRTTMKEFHNWLTDLYDEEKGKKTKNKHKEDWKQEDMQEDWEQEAMQEKNGQGQRWKGTAAFSKASTWVDLHPPFP